jgi:uncharacterized protein YegL
MPERPGGSLAKRPLHFIWLLDCSGSMQGKKIEKVNYAIREAIKPMQDVADENPNAEVLVRAIKFSDGAQWHISQPIEIHKFKWADVNADGVTDMGKALTMLADELKVEKMPGRGLPPVLLLLSDGQPTDDFNGGLKALMDEPWGKKAVRIAIAIGEDADEEVLQKFIGNPEVKPLRVTNVQDLVKKVKWASTVPLQAASNPHSRTKDTPGGGSNVPIPAPPSDAAPASANDVF